MLNLFKFYLVFMVGVLVGFLGGGCVALLTVIHFVCML